MTPSRILFVSGGNADLVTAHEHWARGESLPSETSITFSGQVADFVTAIGAEALMLSAHPDGRTLAHGAFRVEHRPRRTGRGLRYHLLELRHALSLARAGRRFGATLAVVDSGAVPFYLLPLFRRAGMAVIVVLHNTLWPHGFRPQGRSKRLIERLDARFFKAGALAAVAVSPEAARQVDELCPDGHCPVYPVRAQFERGYFEAIPPAPDWAANPFRMMFIGRVIRAKGVFDILAMARAVERRLPGRVRWTICGRGPDLDALRAEATDLAGIVDIRGWTSLPDLAAVYAETHAAIVPTTSGFAEGLAMTAAEAVLAGRPVVTNPVVPAHEVLAPAVLLGRTNDPSSHAEQVVRLASDRALYERLRDACSPLRAAFYDRDQGLAAVLERVVRERFGS
jgi:glycosyltransferase involved in cell wall biosynthesis